MGEKKRKHFSLGSHWFCNTLVWILEKIIRQKSWFQLERIHSILLYPGSFNPDSILSDVYCELSPSYTTDVGETSIRSPVSLVLRFSGLCIAVAAFLTAYCGRPFPYTKHPPSSCAESSLTVWPHGLSPTRLLCPWDDPGKKTGVGCHFLLWGIFLTQRSNLASLVAPALAGRFFTTESPGMLNVKVWNTHKKLYTSQAL